MAQHNKMFAMSLDMVFKNYKKGSHTDSPHLFILTPKSKSYCQLSSVKTISLAIFFLTTSMQPALAEEKQLQALPLLDDAINNSIINREVLAPVLIKEIENSEQKALEFIPINGENLDTAKNVQDKLINISHGYSNKKLLFQPISQEEINLINSTIISTTKTATTAIQKPLQFIPLSHTDSKPENSDKQPLKAVSGNLTVGRPEDIFQDVKENNKKFKELSKDKNNNKITEISWADEDAITDLVDIGPGSDEGYPFQNLLSNVDGVILSIKSVTSYNDNFFTTKDNHTAYMYEVLTPAISLQGDNETLKFSCGFSSTIGLFNEDTADNYADHNLNARVSTRLYEQVAVTLTTSGKWGHDDRGSNDDVADSDSPNRHFTPSAGLKFNLGAEGGIVGLTINSNITNTIYHNHRATTKDLEKEIIGLDVEASVARGPELSVLTGINFQYNNYEHLTNKTSQDLYYFVGVDWKPSDLFNFNGKIGGREKFFINDDTLPAYASFAWGLSMNWIPLEYSTYTLGSRMTTSDSTGSADLFSTRNVDFSWSHKWADFIATDLNSAYSWKISEGSSQTKVDKILNYGAKIGLSIDDWLKLAMGYDHTSLMSNSSSSSYEQNKFLLTIEAQM
ncbi:MAG: outer membrane beta-barrel protein [Magnetococcales bacterium]|nr:outer membrane beta-barrel protein [Magnetococcales bacterium]